MDNWHFNNSSGLSMPYNASNHQTSENKSSRGLPPWSSMCHSDMSLMGQELAMFSFGDTSQPGGTSYSNTKSHMGNQPPWSMGFPSSNQLPNTPQHQGKNYALPSYGNYNSYSFDALVNDKSKNEKLGDPMPWSYGGPPAMNDPNMLPYTGRSNYYGNMGQSVTGTAAKSNDMFHQPSAWSMSGSSSQNEHSMMSLLGRDNFNCNTSSNGMSFSNNGLKDTMSNDSSFWSMGYPMPQIQPPMNTMGFTGTDNMMSSNGSLSNQTSKENLSDRLSAWPLGYPTYPQQQPSQSKVSNINSSNDFNHAIDALLGNNTSNNYKSDQTSSWSTGNQSTAPATSLESMITSSASTGINKISTPTSAPISFTNACTVPSTDSITVAVSEIEKHGKENTVSIPVASDSTEVPMGAKNTVDEKNPEKIAESTENKSAEASLIGKEVDTQLSLSNDCSAASDKSQAGTESGRTTPSSIGCSVSTNGSGLLKRSRKEHEMSSSGESSDDGSEDESSGSSESSADEEDETSSVNGGNKDNEEMGEDGSKSGITIKTECTDDFDSVASNKSYNPDDSDLTESVKVKSENELNASTIPSVLSETVSKTDSKKPSPVKTKKRKRKQDTEKSGKKSKTEKRKKRVKKDSDETSRKNKFERRNIRKIIKENDLEEETKTAQQEEIERKKRLQEQQKKLMNNQCLKALLESSDEEIDVKPKDLQIKHHKFEKKPDVINISSDDEDVVPLSDVAEDEDDDNDDTENSGLHVDDTQNRPDESGLVLVNVGHPEDEPDIFLPPQLSRAVKPHQIGGVRFLYDNLVESLSRFKTSRGFGCILAHSMGLGKTIQVISFIDVFLRHTSAKSVLCIVPINTLQNWIHEFNVWLPTNSATGDQTNDVRPRNFELHTINDNQKNMEARAVVVDKWQRQGGVLLMGYEMYRLLATRKPQKPRKPKKNAGPIVIDLEEEDRNKELAIDMQVALLSPGPDLVICDEGHRIKNSGAGISKALKEIHTKRRVVLTGYPLQNNLVEYWCMVDFVRPNFLGTKLEFSNMFERPIMNAQCVDSTQQDLKVMRERAHVLHSLLEGFVQRRGHAVLKYTLPVKHECVIIVRMSDIQRALYKEFMNILTLELESWASMNPLKAFSVCCKIWNHPDVIYKFFNQRKGTDVENDLDIGDPDNDAGKKSKKQTKTKNKQTPKNATDLAVEAADSKMLPDESNSKRDTVITYDWATELLKDYIPGNLQNSGKFVILFEMIREILAFGDKLLIFSQSLMTLNLIEEYLGKTRVPVPGCVENWVRNKHYFRLDGSTSGIDREKLINMFNNPESTDLHLFLLSTKAGCLGINLIGANRVIIMDASWNPCHDAQAVCRIYRYGQTKPCHIYRLVTDNTLENKIYQRQVSKQTVADRVVDEMNPNNNFSRRQVDSLLEYEDKDMPSVDLADLPVIEDEVLSRVLFSVIGWLTKAPFNHESLLLDQKECKLTKAEKRLARQRYEREKKRNLTYQRPSYAAYYPTAAGHSATMRPNPMIANRRPYDAPLLHPTLPTPIPMQPHQKVRPPFLASQQLQNSGVSVHQVVTTTDIVMPGTNTSTDSGTPSRIPAGQQIMVIKTQKGVYIRTAEGRIFAVRSNKALLDQCQ